MSKIKLSGHIKAFRIDRPSEWLMDEFMREAETLEARVAELEKDNKQLGKRLRKSREVNSK